MKYLIRYDRWKIKYFDVEENRDEERYGSKPFELTLLFELFNSGLYFISFAFLLGFANNPLQESFVPKRLVVSFALIFGVFRMRSDESQG